VMVPNPGLRCFVRLHLFKLKERLLYLVCGPQEGRIVPEEYYRSTAIAVDVTDPLLIQNH